MYRKLEKLVNKILSKRNTNGLRKKSIKNNLKNIPY